jgi:hypothetical protein
MNALDMDVVVTGVDLNGLPYVSVPENIDKWPSEAATEEAIKSVIEIVERGYGGVKIECHLLSNDRSLSNFHTNIETPEGRLVQVLMAFASKGKSIPKTEAVSILERIYREQGLPLPTKNKPGV